MNRIEIINVSFRHEYIKESYILAECYNYFNLIIEIIELQIIMIDSITEIEINILKSYNLRIIQIRVIKNIIVKIYTYLNFYQNKQ